MTKVSEGIQILEAIGMPRAQQNNRSAWVLLALTDLKEEDAWACAKQRLIKIHDITQFINVNYPSSVEDQKRYKENTRESVRKQTLHQFVQAGIADANPDCPTRPTNSPKYVYAITSEALETIRHFGTEKWSSALAEFIAKKGRLKDRYDKRKEQNQIPVKLPQGDCVTLSPGKHNELQNQILQKFLPNFFPKSKVIYLGDTAKKMLFFDETEATKLNIPITQHDELPDIVLYDEEKNVLLLIEAVTSVGPVSAKRQIELEEMLKNCKARRIYVTAFPDFRVLKRHITEIAWETEIWLADNPDHMIHFNGPKFLNAA